MPLEGVDGMGNEGEGVVMMRTRTAKELALVRVQMWRLGTASASEDSDDGDDDKQASDDERPYSSPSCPLYKSSFVVKCQ